MTIYGMKFRTRLRGSIAICAVTVLALTMAACSGEESDASAGEVLVYDGGGAWGDAQRKAFFEPFEEETGIKVVPVAGDAPAALRTTIESGAPSMDVMDITPFDLAGWSAADLVEAIDYDSWTAVDRDDFEPYPAEKNGVPSLIFATQIAYDQKTVDAAIDDWAQFWDTAGIPGKRTMGNGSFISTGIFEAALLADGVPREKLYPLDIDRAFKKLDEIKPDILKFWESGAESAQLLADGQVVAAAAWNGRVDSLQAEDSDIKSTWNDAILTVDYWVIPKGAPNSENAQKFIEFAARPDRQASFAEAITYAPTNPAAYDEISAERQAVLPTSPEYEDAVVVASNEFWNSDSGNGTPWSEEILDRWQKWLAN